MFALVLGKGGRDTAKARPISASRWVCVSAVVAVVTLLTVNVRTHAEGTLGPQHVLILVNADSPASVAIAHDYRRYYPSITDEQVLYLTGLPDSASQSATPANEIITRNVFEAQIAQPLRDYLINHGMVDTIYCFITTAGMPYRIEDTDPALANVIKPAGSDAILTATNRNKVDAASVESELAVLFQIDPTAGGSALPIDNRLVNPYQGYKSGILSWSADRNVISRRAGLKWTYMWRVKNSPKIEGLFDFGGFSSKDRSMSPADIYLVARLDGPRRRGELPIFSVDDMLSRSAKVSNPNDANFCGYSPWGSVVVTDTSPGAPDRFSYSQVYNFPNLDDFLNHQDHPVPPGAESFSGAFNEGDHYERSLTALTGLESMADEIDFAEVVHGLGGVEMWDGSDFPMTREFLPPGPGLFALLTYGANAGDGRPVDYLLRGGPWGSYLFGNCVPGAVFSSLESFNAVTMFTDVYTGQGKIAEFIQIGGTAAAGHAFEPERGALFQGEFMIANLLRDDDGNQVGDLTWVEAAFTGMPYVSWAEVVIGDPLMRIRCGPGSYINPYPPIADANLDGRVDFNDVSFIYQWLGWGLGDPDYCPSADLDRNGIVDWDDIDVVFWYLLGYF